jgi:hypothetical protein
MKLEYCDDVETLKEKKKKTSNTCKTMYTKTQLSKIKKKRLTNKLLKGQFEQNVAKLFKFTPEKKS